MLGKIMYGIYGGQHIPEITDDIVAIVEEKLSPFAKVLQQYDGETVDRMTAHLNELAENTPPAALALHFRYIGVNPQSPLGSILTLGVNGGIGYPDGHFIGRSMAEIVEAVPLEKVPAAMLMARMHLVGMTAEKFPVLHTLKCEECGKEWGSEFVSDFCPACGECVHSYELRRGECSWCFGGIEFCSNCGDEIQHHEEFCPHSENEDYIFVGEIHLRAWRMENRHQPFDVARVNGIELAESPRSGWVYAVWVSKSASPKSLAAAKMLVNMNNTAFGSGQAI